MQFQKQIKIIPEHQYILGVLLCHGFNIRLRKKWHKPTLEEKELF